MDMPSKVDKAKKLLALQQEFKLQLPEKIAEIEQYFESSIEDSADNIMLEELHRRLIALADSAGTFGADNISELARKLELVIKPLIKESIEKSFDPQPLEQLFELLKKAANEWLTIEMPVIRDTDVKEKHDEELIYLLLGDELLAEELAVLLVQFGYKVQRFFGLNEIENASINKLSVLLIMDSVFTVDGVAGTELITSTKCKLEAYHPLIYISESDDIEHRLAAARSGADRFFSKPLSLKKLTQTVRALKADIDTTPYRVLLIDNDLPLLELYTIVLEEAGMIVKAMSNPLEGFKVLAEFKPDVVITDVYMPECSGPELVHMIRQDDRYAQVPILFLSGEQNINSQLDAMKLGADDFLTKPVETRKLRMMVAATAKRARQNIRLNNDLKNSLRENKYQLITLDQHAIVSTTDVAGRII
ncbi:MAG: response regulator, partial [Gammaproteobacteria bacterium]|nr:response regulator [Gammaproteobacteria bacterium]